MKLVNFSIILIVLTVLDFITTTYALANKIGYEANPFMSIATGSAVIFSAVKVFGVMMILGIYRWIGTKSRSIVHAGQTLILCMMIVVVGNNMIMIGSAYDVLTTPYSMAKSYTAGYEVAISQGSASWVYNNTGGVLNAGLSRTIGGTVTTYIDSAQGGVVPRGIFVLSSHAIGTCPYTQCNISKGVYSSTNTEGYTVIDTSAYPGTSRIPIVETQSGDLVYAGDTNTILRIARLRDGVYVPELLYTIQNSSFGTGHLETQSGKIYDLAMDSNGNINVLYGNTVSAGNLSLTHFAVSTSGVLIMYETAPLNTISPTRSTVDGFIVPDAVNGTYNFIYNIETSDGSWIYHRGVNASLPGQMNLVDAYGGSTPLTHGTGATDAIYANGTYFVSDATAGRVYHYGFGQYSGYEMEGTVPTTGIYTHKSVLSVNDAYYNTSALEAYFYVSYTANSSNKGQIYHKINLVDNNSAVLGSYYPFVICEPTGITDQYLAPNYMYRCDASSKSAAWSASALGTIGRYVQFTSARAWLPGNYTFKLYEMPSNALLDDDTFVVLDNSSGLVTTAPVVNVHSPENTISIGIIDNWVSLLGMGVTDISKLLFSLIVITVVGLVAMKAAGGTVAMVAVFAPYIFFTYIEYIPKWIFIIVILLLAIVSKVFR